jgi:pantoate--beta-alanine ligase
MVSVAGMTEVLEGAHRGRAHFDGVTTVVTKLLNMVMPDVAYFGQKDAQQALVIRRLVRDLDMAVRIEVGDTVREPDGLAMSSRNALLSESDRARAAALHRALAAISDAVAQGELDAASARARGLTELSAAGIEPEYLELVSARTLAPVQRIDGDVLALIAAKVGATRLIDNEPIHGAENGRY